MKYLKRMDEMIKVDIKVGDTVLGGRFKNKKIKVKKIGKNKKGDITINGKPLLKFRIIKEGVNLDEELILDNGYGGITLMFEDGYHVIGHSSGDRDNPTISFLLEMEDGVWWTHTNNKEGFSRGLEDIMKWNSIWENLLLTYPNSEIDSDAEALHITIPISDFGRMYRDDLMEYWLKHEL